VVGTLKFVRARTRISPIFGFVLVHRTWRICKIFKKFCEFWESKTS